METLVTRLQTYHRIVAALEAFAGVSLAAYQGGPVPYPHAYHSDWQPRILRLKRSLGEFDEATFFPIWNVFVLQVEWRRSLLHPIRGRAAVTLGAVARRLANEAGLRDPEVTEGDVIPTAYFRDVKDKTPVGYRQRLLYHQGLTGHFEIGGKQYRVLSESIAIATTCDSAVWELRRGPAFQGLPQDTQPLYDQLASRGRAGSLDRAMHSVPQTAVSAPLSEERGCDNRSDRDPTASSAYAEDDWNAY